MRPDKEANSILPYSTGVDRRAGVYEQLGIEPLGFRAASSVRNPEDRGKVHVYLDVSQSMDELLPLLYAALRPLLPVIHDKVHLFSSAVRDVSPAAIRNGLAETTEATSLDCVVRHIENHRVRRAVVITDGDGQYPAKEDLARLRSLGARVNKIVTADAWTESLEGIPGGSVRTAGIPHRPPFFVREGTVCYRVENYGIRSVRRCGNVLPFIGTSTAITHSESHPYDSAFLVGEWFLKSRCSHSPNDRTLWRPIRAQSSGMLPNGIFIC